MRSVVTCTSILLSLSVSAFASDVSDNWPQWRGPNFNGSSDTGNPPVEWSETKNVRWKIEVPGKGSATPIIWENRIYVLTAIPTDRKAEGAAAAAAEPPADQQQGRGGRGGAEVSAPRRLRRISTSMLSSATTGRRGRSLADGCRRSGAA
ncbi:MAG: hypothetical protein R3C19_18765 [Planctomycetaceae bacterium]